MKYVLAKPTPQHRAGRTVKDVMSTHVITVNLETTAKQIATVLDKKGITRVPVVDKENKLDWHSVKRRYRQSSLRTVR